MSNQDKPRSVPDDELLANAIPIDTSEEEQAAEEELDPVELASVSAEKQDRSKIRAFGQRQGSHADNWSRKPNATGQGAIHVRTFVTKLRLDAIEYLDAQINEWLDEHPEYEVKFVTTTVGQLVGKHTEDALFVNVWV